MNMQHMTDLMDQSFKKLQEIHESHKTENEEMLMGLANSLLNKLAERDELIQKQSKTIERLNKELRNERQNLAIS